MKTWKLFGDECPICGCEAEVLTTAKARYLHTKPINIKNEQ